MNILFLTLLEFESLQERGIYTDLLREFVKNNHKVFVISPVERRKKIETHCVDEDNSFILRLKIGNTQKTNVIEKGISTVMIEQQFKNAIKKFFSGVRFDMVLYSTPPVTFVGAIEYVKKRDAARTYLLLKDIFPQNAVDIGLMRKGGIIYNYFRRQETRLYSVSDMIGCMSEANVKYLIEHNPQIDYQKVEVCPNSIEVVDKCLDEEAIKCIKTKYAIPPEKKVFIYGGNLGKPQGIPFLIECLKSCRLNDDVYFLIVGDGTEYSLIEDYSIKSMQGNLKLLRRLPKEEFDNLVCASDVGMVFLDHRFTIPNFPSRILSYMQAKKPILAVTDPNTDIGEIITEGGFGWWCESGDVKTFEGIVSAISADKEDRGIRGFEYLKKHYSSADGYKVIMTAYGK